LSNFGSPATSPRASYRKCDFQASPGIASGLPSLQSERVSLYYWPCMRITSRLHPSIRQKVVMTSDQDLYLELSYYTLAHPNPSFIHQHIVTLMRLTCRRNWKANRSCLRFDWTLLARREKLYWQAGTESSYELASSVSNGSSRIFRKSGSYHSAECTGASPGQSRDAMIHNWCASVWTAWNESAFRFLL